ncbi:hypothetical protein ACK3TF_005497 [Chlorella vulgaris]
MASLTCCLPGVPRSAPRAKVDGLRTRHAPLCVTVRRCRLPPASALQRRDNGGGPVKPYLSLFQKTPSWEEIDELSGGSECLNHELSRLALERLISAARVDGLRTRHAPLCVAVRRCRLPPASALQRRDNGGGPVKPYLSLFQKTPSWEEIDELSGGSEVCACRQLLSLPARMSQLFAVDTGHKHLQPAAMICLPVVAVFPSTQRFKRELSRLALERLRGATKVRLTVGMLAFFACAALVVLRLSEGHLFDNVPGGVPSVLGFGFAPAPLPVLQYFRAHSKLKSAIEQAFHDRN